MATTKLLLIPFLLIVLRAGAQEPVPRFHKQGIANTGLSVYAPTDSFLLEASYSEDSSLVYSGAVDLGSFSFSVIAVEFREPLTDYTVEDMEGLLESYLDFLQGQLGVTESAGYGEGHRLESDSTVIGVIDYWQDDIANQYAVKGWVNPYNLVVLYIVGIEEYPYYNAQQMYLDGVRFN
jgi:hypothetical protein